MDSSTRSQALTSKSSFLFWRFSSEFFPRFLKYKYTKEVCFSAVYRRDKRLRVRNRTMSDPVEPSASGRGQIYKSENILESLRWRQLWPWGFMLSGSSVRFSWNVISQERVDGISWNLAQTSTWTHAWRNRTVVDKGQKVDVSLTSQIMS